MSTPTAVEIASLLLENIGDTPDQVAQELAARGIAGVRNTTNELNPIAAFIARYLREQVPEVQQVVAARDHLRILLRKGRKERVLFPAPVRRFLAAFNRGRYPELKSSGRLAG